MKQRRFALIFYSALLIFSSVSAGLLPASKAQAARSIIFPIAGGGQFSNDFNAPRGNGLHHATDIFAPKHRKLVSPVDGRITFAPYPQPSYGYAVFITDDDGYDYTFIHLNNDRPGTDDGRGGGKHAYAPDVKSGNRVVKGQHIGYVGDSGNAENTPPHLHFEMHAPNGSVINPYDSLRQAPRIAAPKHYPQLAGELLPYGNRFSGGIHLAMGNFDADTESEMVTAAGYGGGPHVKVFDDDDTFIGPGFYAYNSKFTGGVDVAAGDIDGDGIDEIITVAGKGGGPHVKVFKLDGTVVSSFYAYNPAFTKGVHVAAGDIDGDGVDEIITGTGKGGGPHVKAFEADTSVVAGFYAYAPGFNGGVDVASGDITDSAGDEIITGAGPGGGAHVKVLSAAGAVLEDFNAYAQTFTGGVRVSAGNVRINTPEDEIVTAPWVAGGPHIKMVDASGTSIRERSFLEQWWEGSYDIAAGNDTSRAAAGTNRRVTVRVGVE
jgi:hypothetical protein